MEIREVGSKPGGVRHYLPCLGVFLFGLAIGTSLCWPALSNYGIYTGDIVQSPHWAAYHSSSFRTGDPVLLYASFNESPMQNAIYWLGTWFIEYITLTKVLGVASYGLLAVIFFVIGRAMYGLRVGLLLSLFITLLPHQWEFSAGFFSKFWAIPSILVCVFLLQTNRWKGLIALLPVAALAYPTAAVIVGLTASVYCLQESVRCRADARRLLRYLAIGSALAVGLLMVKYISPPEFIGPMRSGAELRTMQEVRPGGYPSHYAPIPSLDIDLIARVKAPIVLACAVIYFLVLGRRGVAWERSWTALFLAAMIGYVLADLFFMRLYIPNRYTRYSMAVLLALWNARNFDLVLARANWRPVRWAAVALLLVVGVDGAIQAREEGAGWGNRSAIVPLCHFIREELPPGILIAGAPKPLDDVAIQAKRSVLIPFKLAHPWFVTYYHDIREKTRASLFAHFADGPARLNRLHRRFGVTHFLVEKRLFARADENGKLFVRPFSKQIYKMLGERRKFYLRAPPPHSIAWEDDAYALIRLPIGVDEAGEVRSEVISP